MASEKCFCHLNGYKVKDADAHASIKELQLNVSACFERLTELEQSGGASGGGGGFKLYKHNLHFLADPTDPGAPSGTNIIISTRETAYTDKSQIYEDWINGKITYMEAGYTKCTVLAYYSSGLATILMGTMIDSDSLSFTCVFNNDTITEIS